MKPALRQITSTSQSSFLVRKDTGDRLVNNWHYHPEIELLYMKKSSGTWLIGDHIGHFQSGDIVLIGANLPHCFRHELDYMIPKSKNTGETICIKFVPDIFGTQFLNIPETKTIKELLTKCNCGLQLSGTLKNNIAASIEKILTESPTKKLIYLLTVLDEISDSKEYTKISSTGFVRSSTDTNNDRIKLIFEYTFNHYSEKITLNQVAALLNMTIQSFCRYFKKNTKKTYIKFLMEVRIGHACRLLAEDDRNVSQICYECGYENISHFNHQFKMITKKTPLKYKMYYLKILSDQMNNTIAI